MIEQSVSLASNGVVKVPGYEQLVRFGYTKNRGVYRLAVTASGEWEGLTIRAFWHVPDGKDPASSLVVDGYVDVPASVTAQPGNGCITFEGSDGTTTVTSADLRYRVSTNSGTEDGTEPEPGTPAWQQLVDAVHTDAAAAEQAKTDAQTAAQQAGAAAQKAGQALSDTITAKEAALKAIGDKQTAATQAVDTARDKALQQVEASTEAAQTAASEAATSAGSADRSAQAAAGSLQELKDGIASGDFKGEPGNDGKSPVVTVTDIENGHRVSITDKDGTKTIDVLNGQTGKTGATPVLTIGTVSSGDKPSADITGTPENPVLNLRLQPGPQGPAVALDTTLTHEGEAADAKATGNAISAVKSRQNFLIGSETGNPIAVDDAFSAPLCGLTVYGKSTQDGTPTPDAPVPIVSAGDGGSVAVKVTGKNLLHLPDGSGTGRGVTITAKDGLISISGTATETGYSALEIPPLITSGVAILSSSIASPEAKLVAETWDAVLSQNTAAKMPTTATRLVFIITQGQTYNLTGVKVQLELGSTATAYSPYREQLLTLPTPTGLPGIPVTSGGNYVDQSGQQWVCDEVDLKRGVKVQRVKSRRILSSEVNDAILGVNSCYIIEQNIARPANNGQIGHLMCTHLERASWSSAVDKGAQGICVISNQPYIGITIQGFKSANEYKDFIDKNEVGIAYQLATPIETPLTSAELSAYRALTAYGPDTVVQAGDGAGIKLDYQRDVNIAIKKLEDAVASMT